MALSTTEQSILESVKSMLGDDTELGLKIHDYDKTGQESSAQWQRENVCQQFALDTNSLTHHQGITAAFKKVHDYKPLESPTFSASFRRELTAQAIPQEEITKALDIAEKVLNKVIGKKANERDSGWHPDLDEVMATANPE